MKTALLFVIAGLIVEMFCVVDLTPGRFVVLALVGTPLVLAGMVIFVVTVWRVLASTRGL